MQCSLDLSRFTSEQLDTIIALLWALIFDIRRAQGLPTPPVSADAAAVADAVEQWYAGGAQ